MEEADRQKTAFNTSKGLLYQMNMMPFGLCNASMTFQRDIVLHGLKWYNSLVYIDDIVVVGGSMLEHLQNQFQRASGHLARWLEKLQEYEFTILHCQGSQHSNADALSRITYEQCGRGDLCGIKVCAVDAILPHYPQTNCSDEVRRVQAEDIIGPVLEAV